VTVNGERPDTTPAAEGNAAEALANDVRGILGGKQQDAPGGRGWEATQARG
jgi:hypothetical protein